jgi:F420-dependent oxidoreductase-like protein
MAFSRLGFQFSSVSYPDMPVERLFGHIVDVAVAAEQNGFGSIWLPDHTMQNHNGGGTDKPMFEAYSLLAALAARTERATLAAMVSPVTFRNPGLLAKTVTTLDVISGGRAALGIGAGWDTTEHPAYGIPFPEVAERQDRLEEAVQICRAMFTEESPSFTGTYYSIDNALNSPRPIQSSIPIVVAGGGERRTLRTAARLADASNVAGTLELLAHKLDVLAAHCADAGRDFATITKTASVVAPTDLGELVEAVESRRALGFDTVVLMANSCPDADTVASWGQALA